MELNSGPCPDVGKHTKLSGFTDAMVWSNFVWGSGISNPTCQHVFMKHILDIQAKRVTFMGGDNKNYLVFGLCYFEDKLTDMHAFGAYGVTLSQHPDEATKKRIYEIFAKNNMSTNELIEPCLDGLVSK
ncbi:uncharacterized protein LOC115626517 [Scaptodrosophila lebanonensis]|uniref:Uncharacterized protein LOC115626517 n=1 Tax=Drosophila lebanonensis TaxID=7225 RepID=A0A6J2TMG5_DROLE|nr:uncharacterized protein LOC115626517 [Scaptodrosophila lebanonensis]